MGKVSDRSFNSFKTSNIAQIHQLIQLISFYVYLFTIQLEYNFI